MISIIGRRRVGKTYLIRTVYLIRALASTPTGLTRTKLLAKTNLSDSSRITQVLTELSESGFISTYAPFGKKKKGTLFRLTDEYSIFYLRFIENNSKEIEGIWASISQGQAYKIWCAYAFENICLKHIASIKKALGISGIYSSSSSFYQKAREETSGVQIDLLIDRNDQSINLVEIKFYNGLFFISKTYAQKLQEKSKFLKQQLKQINRFF